MDSKDSKATAVFVWAILSAVLSFVGSICWSVIKGQEHMWAYATLWAIGGFVVALLMFASIADETGESEDNTK